METNNTGKAMHTNAGNIHHEGNKNDFYAYSMLPVSLKHRMIITEGVPLLPSSFLRLTKLSSQSMRKYIWVTNCLWINGAGYPMHMMLWLRHNAGDFAVIERLHKKCVWVQSSLTNCCYSAANFNGTDRDENSLWVTHNEYHCQMLGWGYRQNLISKVDIMQV